MLTNPNASASQKGQAISQVGTTILTDAVRKTAKENAPAIKEALKQAAPVLGIAGATAGILKVGGVALSANRRREARNFADRELARTRQKLGARLTPEMAATLWQQYFDFAAKKPVTNPFIGK